MGTPHHVSRLRRWLAQEEQERDAVDKDLLSCRSRIQEKESKVAQLQHHLQKVRREQSEQEVVHKTTLQELQKKNDGLLERLHHEIKLSQDLKTSNVQKDKREDDLTKEIGLLSTQVRELTGQLALLQQQIMLLQEAELQVSSRKQELEQELSQALQHKEFVGEQLEIEQGKVCVMKEELMEARSQLCNHGEVMGPIMECDNLQQEVTKLKAELQEAASAKAADLVALEMEHAQNASLLQDVTKLQSQLQEAASERKACLVCLKAEVAQNKVLRQKAMRHQEEVTSLQSQLLEAAKQRHAHLVSMETDRAERMALQQEAARLQVRLQEWEESEQRAELRVQALRREMETLHMRNSTLQRENSATRRLNDALQQQLEKEHVCQKEDRQQVRKRGERGRIQDLSKDTFILDASLISASTPMVRGSSRLALKRGSDETLCYTSMGPKQTTRSPGDHLTHTAQRRRSVQKESSSLQFSAEPGNNITTATAATSNHLLNLPGYRRSKVHSAAPTAASSAFCVGLENEPEAGTDWQRIAELQRRNKNYPQHLKSSYTLETMQGAGAPSVLMSEEEVRFGDPSETLRRASTCPGQPPASLTSHRLSLLPAKRPATNQDPASPKVKRQATGASRPMTLKDSLANQSSPMAERRESLMFCVANTPPKRVCLLGRGRKKLGNSPRRSPRL